MNDNKRGLVIVAVLWVVMLLLIIIAGVGRSSRLETKVCVSQVQQLRCKWGCSAGVEFAVALLAEEQQVTNNTAEQLLEVNSNNKIELEGCTVVFDVVDESGKLNINTATKDQLMGLYNMTEEIADAIIDWRDRDDDPAENGAEAGYYANLPYGYTIRNDNFRTVRELLMVKGVTEKLLYGENYKPLGTLNADQQISSEHQENRPWIYDLTCYSRERNVDADGNRRININRENENRLQRDLDIKSSQAKWIVDNRKNGNYKSIADLLNDNSSKKSSNSSNSKQSQSKNQGSNKDQSQSQSQPQGQGRNQSRNQDSSQASDRSQNQQQAEAIDLETFSKIADKITVNNRRRIEGLVNINTASKNVLMALLGQDTKSQQLADNIIAYRQTQVNGFESIADLLNVNSFKLEDLKKIAESITTRSNIYMINCLTTAADNGAKVSGETVIDTSYDPYRLLYRYKGTSN